MVFSIDGKTLHLHDVLSERELRFEEVLSGIGKALHGVGHVVLHYTPDYPDLHVEPEPADAVDRMFVLGNTDILPARFRYPEIAIT